MKRNEDFRNALGQPDEYFRQSVIDTLDQLNMQAEKEKRPQRRYPARLACTFAALVLAITGALKVFDLPWVMFGAGMPENQGWLTGTYMYDQTFNRMNVDYGSTIAVLIVVLGVVLSNVANRVFKPSDDL